MPLGSNAWEPRPGWVPSSRGGEEGCPMFARFRPGDVVVYRKQKNSVHPGPHARDIQPAPHGDSYAYAVEKFWRVEAVRPDHTLVVRTRKGKQHTIAADDPNLR